MDERAQNLLAAGRAVLPQLDELLGKRGKKVERELRTVIDDATASWQAEAVRDILFKHPATRKYLLEAVPEAKSPRPFEGGGGGGRHGFIKWYRLAAKWTG